MFSTNRAHRAMLFFVVLALASGAQAVLGEEADDLTAATAPLPTLVAERLREESLGYRATITMPQGDMTIDVELAVAKGTFDGDAGSQPVWRIAYSELGPVPRSITTTLRQADLALLERFVSMPDVDTTLRFGADSVIHSMSSDQSGFPNRSGDDVIPLPQPVLANLDVAVLALPLAEGFETLARTFELLLEVAHWNVAVVGSEAVQTPAGTFESYKVALTRLDNDGFSATTWVTKEAPYRIVRRESAYLREISMGRLVLELASVDEPGPD